MREIDGHELLKKIQIWANDLGFSQLGVSDVDLRESEQGLQAWIAKGWHGEMDYMRSHGTKRTRPNELLAGTTRVISVRMDYLPKDTPSDWRETEHGRLSHQQEAVVSLYARGRDYHKVLRSRLQKLCEKIESALLANGLDQSNFKLSQRPFVDSAPVMEVALAEKAGLGWRGKHTLLLNRAAGSMFFLGEIYTNLPLPLSQQPQESHCGSCQACIDVCPTKAIKAPYKLDARACISYLTIEHAGAIPVEFRRAIGNRIYGCDDCQTVCPWNKYAKCATLTDFDEREGMSRGSLLELFAWDEAEFLSRTEGSAIRRIGYERWTRNLVVALGNSSDANARAVLIERYSRVSELVQSHINWALKELGSDPN